MDVQEQHERGLKLRVEMFGQAAVDKRTNALGEFGKPLQHFINTYAYGDVWSRSALHPSLSQPADDIGPYLCIVQAAQAAPGAPIPTPTSCMPFPVLHILPLPLPLFQIIEVSTAVLILSPGRP